MSWRRYFPSAQFSFIAISLVSSAGLVYAADFITKPPVTTAQLSTSQIDRADTVQNADWQQSLQDIQTQSGISAPQAPDPATVSAMVKAAQTANVTQSVGRTLLINLENAKAQGLGDDIPTQNQIISDALTQVPQPQTKLYTQQDLTVVNSSKDAEHTYANALMAALEKHQQASMQQTLVVVATATDQNDASGLSQLTAIETDYRALTKDIAAIPVPQTMVPIHLQILNDFAQITDSYPDMAEIISDPVLGLSGLQTYKTLTDETLRMFTNVAQEFSKDGILFASGEPGAQWASVLTSQQ
jgi:phosphohistidine swiveling domain-containing protein